MGHIAHLALVELCAQQCQNRSGHVLGFLLDAAFAADANLQEELRVEPLRAPNVLVISA